MCPQFVDFDNDSYTDIIAATYEGTVFIVRGSAEGWLEPEHLVDAKGRNLILSLYYDMEANAYKNADRSPEGTSNPKDHCVSAMVWDWDNDGDFDILLGAYEGRLYLQRNEGKPGKPKFTGVNELLEAGGEPFNVKGGLTAPRLVDWDDDGLDDLICGGFEGGVFFYRNVGQVGAPKFAEPRTLIEPIIMSDDEPAGPSEGFYVDPVDYDGDGDLDLLVGGYARYIPKPPELNEEQEARLAAIRAEMEELSAKMTPYIEAVQKAMEVAETDEERMAANKIYEDEEFEKLAARNRELYDERGKLEPNPSRVAGIWLYRRK